MSHSNHDWDPADGPEPTDEEREEAAELATAVAGALMRSVVRPTGGEPALLDTALRVHSTVHTDEARVRAITTHAIERALERQGQRWYHHRWRMVAAAAAVLVAGVGLGGVQLAQLRGRDRLSETISGPVAADVFEGPIPQDARSMPIGRITEVRTRAYRDTVLFGTEDRP